LAANVDLASETADIGVLGDGLVGNMPERTGLCWFQPPKSLMKA
jgi:hypothetical protein